MRLATILFAFALIYPSWALAGCSHPTTSWRFGSTFSATWVSTDGGICSSHNFHPENIASITMVTRASHGIAGRTGPSLVAYKPNPGFKGTDFFEYAVTSNGHYREGAGLVAYVRINVVVE
jgi:hypothetical protein